MIWCVIVPFLFCVHACHASETLFPRVRAITLGKAGDHAGAKQLLEQMLVQRPHDAQLLYDAGVATFKCGDYAHAASYFEKAAQNSDVTVHQEALFNAGNSYAHAKEYDKALAAYEKLLAENADHEQVRHNYEQVKKLQEQEKQEQPEDHQDDQDKDEQQDQDEQEEDQQQGDGDDQDGNDDGQSDSDQSDDSGEDDGEAGGESSSDSGENGDKNKQSQNDQNKNNKQNKKSASSDEAGESDDRDDTDKNSDKSDRDSNTQNPTHGDDSPGDKDRTYNQKQKQQAQQSHTPAPSSPQESRSVHPNDSGTGTQQEDLHQVGQMPKELEGSDKGWMRMALETCDKQDNKHNKQLLRALVGTDKGDARGARSSW